MTITTPALKPTLRVVITPNEKGNPPGKLADAELHFGFDPQLRQWAESVLAISYAPTQIEARTTQDLIRTALTFDGLRLIGFAIWERRTGNARNVTFPARQYSVNGERRSFALLRPIGLDGTGQDRIRALILDAYEEYERATTTAATTAPLPAAPVADFPTEAAARDTERLTLW